jgi:hypothetical protein
MSHRPDIVSDWHGELYKRTPVSADHCARIIRAIYRREARRACSKSIEDLDAVEGGFEHADLARRRSDVIKCSFIEPVTSPSP